MLVLRVVLPLTFFLLLVLLQPSSSLRFSHLPPPQGRPRGIGRGAKWNFGSDSDGQGEGLKQWVDDGLDAIIATDEYIEDMENKIEDLEELEDEFKANLNKEMRDDDEDFEGSGMEYYYEPVYNM
eukprot:GFUD01003773.1.p1 GENE.GFUD01003773.1~~GFUD01003773.1.p1  ORF type:complete len:136 (-),score=43.61 GFUD01003773.1:175-549(-)